MRIHTYSQVWGLRRIFYHIHKMRLPFPVNISELVIFVGTECFSYFVWRQGIHIGFAPQFLIFPFAMTWAMSRMELEGRAPHLFFASLIRYLTRPKLWARGLPVRVQKVQSLELTRVILESHNEQEEKQTDKSPKFRLWRPLTVKQSEQDQTL
jgi:TcpE family